ncbi:hypothetical protein [Neorhizobium sp. P12A]|uniref:hypothetical protein n=1 Tax=Neorhizobium sp. P12A TaxID=2268027 RepID=UPI0011EFCC1A|nr:hypothetical protein [Neorhizobium sp. P12A]
MKLISAALLCAQVVGCAKDPSCEGFDEKQYAKEVMAKKYPQLAMRQIYGDISCSHTETIYSPAIFGWFAPEERGCAIALLPTVSDVSHGHMSDLYEFSVIYNTRTCANSFEPLITVEDVSKKDFDGLVLQDEKSAALRDTVPK